MAPSLPGVSQVRVDRIERFPNDLVPAVTFSAEREIEGVVTFDKA
jgi:hypothetical protein